MKCNGTYTLFHLLVLLAWLFGKDKAGPTLQDKAKARQNWHTVVGTSTEQCTE